MAQFDHLVQRATESLYGDERLRSNLTDQQAKVVLGWAAGWIGRQVAALSNEAAAIRAAESELDRVRRVVSALNALAAGDAAAHLEKAIRAIAPDANSGSALTPEQVLQLATQDSNAISKKRGDTMGQ
jgi:hypothetical protein